MMNVTVRGVKKLKGDLKKERDRVAKAEKNAVKVEAYRLRDVMKNEIRQGAPGGKTWPRLSFLARAINIRTSRKVRKDRPLIRLATGVFYDAQTRGNKFKATVGFEGPRTPSWARHFAAKHQQSFETPISRKFRELIVREGARRGTIEGGRTPFFLKKETKTFKTPARPIIEPFWEKHQSEAMRNIRKNFRAKMAGRRI